MHHHLYPILLAALACTTLALLATRRAYCTASPDAAATHDHDIALNSSSSLFDEAYVFVALSDTYVRLALGLQAALRAVGSTRPCMVLAGPAVSVAAEGAMSLGGIAVVRIPKSPRHPNWRPRWRRWDDLLSKLEVFRVRVRRLVYVDLDTVLRGNPDDLFGCPEPFVASQDNWGCDTARPGTVNSGLMLVRYDAGTYAGMMQTLEHEVIGGGDQEIIGKYWRRRLGRVATLPDSYCTYHTRYNDRDPRCRWVSPEFRKAKIIHLADAKVDWDATALHGRDTPGLARWARPFIQMYKEQNDMAGRAMLELAGHAGVDPSIAAFVHKLYGNLVVESDESNATSDSSDSESR
eukprot:m51a1_g10421 hypothetical protein (350) ;mRNA; f:5415-6608